MTALYSVNLRVMGKSNLPLIDAPRWRACRARSAIGCSASRRA